MVPGMYILSTGGDRSEALTLKEEEEEQQPQHTNTLVRKNCIRATAICPTGAAGSDPAPRVPGTLFPPQLDTGFQREDTARKYRELLRVSFLAVGRLTALGWSEVPSEPVDDCVWLPLLQLLSVAVRAVVARFWVSVVGAAGRPAAAGLLAAQHAGALQGVVSDRGLPHLRVQAAVCVPQAVVVTHSGSSGSGLRPRVVWRLHVQRIRGSQATQGGGAWRVAVLGVGGAPWPRGAVSGKGGVRKVSRVGGRWGAGRDLVLPVAVAVVVMLMLGEGRCCDLLNEGGPRDGDDGAVHARAQRDLHEAEGRRGVLQQLRFGFVRRVRQLCGVLSGELDAVSEALPVQVAVLLLLLGLEALLRVSQVALDHLLLEGLPVAGGEQAGEDELALALHGGSQDAQADLDVAAVFVGVALGAAAPAAAQTAARAVQTLAARGGRAFP